jgi:hypothetical protein
MSAKFNIINLALRRLGTDPISSIGEDTENYRKVDDIYKINLMSLLRAHPWNFAKKEVALSLSADVPVLDDYTYIFDLPTDYLRLSKTDGEDSGYSHKIKGRKLYANSNAVSIEYIALIEDPSAWVTLTAYVVGDYVLQSNTIYYCQTAHTSGTFATDLAAGRWVEMDRYDPAFTDAFATLLAYDLCMPITKDSTLKAVLEKEFRTKFNLAKSWNGQEQTPDLPQDSDWLNSRY